MTRTGKPPGKIEITSKQVAVIIHSSLQGDSYRETSQKANVSTNTVYRCRKELYLI